MLENKADSLEKETSHREVRNPIVCGREQTYTLFTLISEKLADFIIAVTGNRIECELRGVGIVPYSAFEASKVQDYRLAPVPRNSDYKNNPQAFEEINTRKGAFLRRENYVWITPSI